jgi:hypothetical protein
MLGLLRLLPLLASALGLWALSDPMAWPAACSLGARSCHERAAMAAGIRPCLTEPVRCLEAPILR